MKEQLSLRTNVEARPRSERMNEAKASKVLHSWGNDQPHF